MENSLILALDGEKFRNKQYLISTVKKLYKEVYMFKVGLELITFYGTNEIVKILRSVNKDIKIFFDYKLNDIENTILKSVEIIFDLDIDILTVHISVGINSLKSLIKLRNKFKKQKNCKTKIYGVTVLTSLDENEVKNIFNSSTKKVVSKFAQVAVESSLDGIICSGQELLFLNKQSNLQKIKKITPGIRASNENKSEQSRNVTANFAIKNGAYKIVVGRPITESIDMLKACKNILK
jgi:orotidine-5'-phosphate decarboxylase